MARRASPVRVFLGGVAILGAFLGAIAAVVLVAVPAVQAAAASADRARDLQASETGEKFGEGVRNGLFGKVGAWLKKVFSPKAAENDELKEENAELKAQDRKSVWQGLWSAAVEIFVKDQDDKGGG